MYEPNLPVHPVNHCAHDCSTDSRERTPSFVMTSSAAAENSCVMKMEPLSKVNGWNLRQAKRAVASHVRRRSTEARYRAISVAVEYNKPIAVAKVAKVSCLCDLVDQPAAVCIWPSAINIFCIAIGGLSRCPILEGTWWLSSFSNAIMLQIIGSLGRLLLRLLSEGRIQDCGLIEISSLPHLRPIAMRHVPISG